MEENELKKEIERLEQEIEACRKNEARFRKIELELSIILEGVPSFIFLLNRNMQVCKANRATLEFAEMSGEDVFGVQVGGALHCIHHVDVPEGCGYGPFCQDCSVRNAVYETFQTGVGYHRFEACLPFWTDEIPARTFFLTTYFMSFDEEDRVLVCLEDVTDRKKAEEVMEAAKEKFKSITAAVQDAIIMIDYRGSICYWNEAAGRIFNYHAAEVLNKNIHDLFISSDRKTVFPDSFPELWESDRCHVTGRTTELVAQKKDGDQVPIELSLSIVRMDEHWHAIGIVRDITHRKEMEYELEKMAATDQLTGAYNRRKLLDLLDYERRLARRSVRSLCLIMFDIDNFKKINDRYGHSVGDEVLKTLVLVVQRNIREADVLARWGGEEFVILTPDTELGGAVKLAEKLRRIVADADFPEVGHITISLGVAQDRLEESVDAFISRVDDWMYEAKNKGRNQVQSRIEAGS
ncbi:MAG: diguanylate cyclase [Desulfurivibrionaceae bacterium]